MTRSGRWLGTALVGLLAACTKIPPATTGSAMARDTLPDSTSVPASWGNLVAVTVNPAFTNVEQLWFQDSVKQIRLVIYDLQARHLVRKAPLITRH